MRYSKQMHSILKLAERHDVVNSTGARKHYPDMSAPTASRAISHLSKLHLSECEAAPNTYRLSPQGAALLKEWNEREKQDA